ncbi:MAG: F-box protein [Candidatus Endonucleobacter bathymodioli]|uniref:F-box protein n=1 Tax=Candidatus Endonucleibacter bathymodioli TaxID=539814 RepID=A0AA90NQT4_9GAMM|nr:F-box protein [Candidatus Endonucleobacter bathymodioli]
MDFLNSEAQGGSELDAQEQQEQQVLFSELPDVIISNIFLRLSVQDVYSFSKTCHKLKDFVADNAFIARNFFSKLSSCQQDEFKRIAATISEKQLTAWVNQFTYKEQAANDPINLKNSGYLYFPHVLWYTISKLMVNCSKFSLTHKSYFSNHSYDLRFSADSRHLVCKSLGRSVIIWSQDNNGEWAKEYTIPYNSTLEKVYFHGDTSHVPTIDDNGHHTIWGLDTNGKWCKIFTLTHEIRHKSLNISGNCRYVVTTDTISHGDSISIWRVGPTGQLTDETIICKFAERLKKKCISFSSDSTDLVIAFCNAASSVWGIGMDGKWVKKAILSGTGEIVMSTNGSHILTGSNIPETAINILSKQQDSGDWVYKTTTPTPTGLCYQEAISSDGTHVVLSNLFGNIKICSLRTAEEWIETAFTEEVVRTKNIIFSSDNLHLAFGCDNGYIMAWGLTKDKEWIEKVRIDSCIKDIRSVSFSPDNRLILVSFWDCDTTTHGIYELKYADSPTPTLPSSNVCECTEDLGAD